MSWLHIKPLYCRWSEHTHKKGKGIQRIILYQYKTIYCNYCKGMLYGGSLLSVVATQLGVWSQYFLSGLSPCSSALPVRVSTFSPPTTPNCRMKVTVIVQHLCWHCGGPMTCTGCPQLFPSACWDRLWPCVTLKELKQKECHSDCTLPLYFLEMFCSIKS